MEKQINDLLLKMQTGENCIGETANQLLDLFAVSGSLSLADLEKRLDEALDKETPETLNKWLEEKRK